MMSRIGVHSTPSAYACHIKTDVFIWELLYAFWVNFRPYYDWLWHYYITCWSIPANSDIVRCLPTPTYKSCLLSFCHWRFEIILVPCYVHNCYYDINVTLLLFVFWTLISIFMLVTIIVMLFCHEIFKLFQLFDSNDVLKLMYGI